MEQTLLVEANAVLTAAVSSILKAAAANLKAPSVTLDLYGQISSVLTLRFLQYLQAIAVRCLGAGGGAGA